MLPVVLSVAAIPPWCKAAFCFFYRTDQTVLTHQYKMAINSDVNKTVPESILKKRKAQDELKAKRLAKEAAKKLVMPSLFFPYILPSM